MRPIPPLIRWTRDSSILLSGFLFIILLIVYIWWPLAEQVLAYVDWKGPWWMYMDWLLIGIFLFMSLTIIARADLRTDGLIVLVGTVGGLVIEAWGTQTNLWHYYTSERPPLWIIPAWPIATLSIDRITRLLAFLTAPHSNSRGKKASKPEVRSESTFKALYWLVMIGFYVLMLVFVSPTFNKITTILALIFCALLIATPADRRMEFLIFVAGSGLGYFLELWGTTRECWTYYTLQTPPLFAVLAHGMASVAFWRTGLLLKQVWTRYLSPYKLQNSRL